MPDSTENIWNVLRILTYAQIFKKFRQNLKTVQTLKGKNNIINIMALVLGTATYKILATNLDKASG